MNKKFTAKLGAAMAAAAIGLAGLPAAPALADGFEVGDSATVSLTKENYGHNLQMSSRGTYTPQLFEVKSGDANSLAYCIEVRVQQPLSDAEIVPWGEFPGDNKFATDGTVREKVAWISLNSYPTVDVKDLSAISGIPGLTEKDAITATQVAIWTLTDGTKIFPLTNADEATTVRVKGLYDYLLGPANVGIKEASGERPTISISEPAPAFAGELAGPFTITTSAVTASVTSPEGYEIVDVNGQAVDTTAVTSGTDLYVRVPEVIPADRGVSLEATATGWTVGSNIVVTAQGSKRGQTIILTWSDQQTPSAKVEIDASMRPKDTDTPTPTETETATPTPTESTPATNEPTPSNPTSTEPTNTTPGLSTTGQDINALPFGIGSALLIAAGAIAVAIQRRKAHAE